MIYPDDLEVRIGFDRIRQQISKLISTETAREMLHHTGFSTDPREVKLRLGKTFEMRTILMLESDFPQNGYKDINHFLHKVRIIGTHLETTELSQLLAALELLKSLTSFFRSRENNPYPLLRALTDPIGGYDEIISSINRIIDRHGRIKDNASPELLSIRRELNEKSGQISKRLQQILKKAQADGYAEADSLVSIRDGRSVIPITAANKRKIRGFVHDESATGRTAFIEPIEIVELNNEVKELESAERREIIKVLTVFTDSLRPHIDELMGAGEYIAEIDMIVAKARHALSINATMPIISESRAIMLRSARHPILEQTLKKEGKAIVPLDLKLDPQKHILLISGPNAGGKSVCLKTVGLLQYMLQCGMLVPLLENSEMSVFDGIFIDIGDQQSIENDLSTYSSHLINMKNMLRHADNRSLVLIDEFGSGTEPTIGGAIAESVLQKLEERGVFGVITTHYANLKYYASAAKGIVNGAMTFDLQKIQPLFKLEMGHAGSSFAFEIARKIGMPEEIISMSTEKIGSGQINIEKQIKDAARDKRYWENKREKIHQVEKAIDRTVEKYESELSEIQQQRNLIIKEAKGQAKELLAETNRTIEKTIREIKEAAAERDKTRAAREGLNSLRDKLGNENADDQLERKIIQLREKEARRKERTSQRQQKPDEKQEIPATVEKQVIEPGSKVRLIGQPIIGEVISISDNKAAVMFGNIITSARVDKIELVPQSEFRRQKRQEYAAPSPQSYDTAKKRMDFRGQLDVRGMRAVEALEAVEDFVDESIMLGIPKVTILHGKGTGALKQEIRNYLKAQPIVSSTKDEQEEFGGAGITVVQLDI